MLPEQMPKWIPAMAANPSSDLPSSIFGWVMGQAAQTGRRLLSKSKAGTDSFHRPQIDQQGPEHDLTTGPIRSSFARRQEISIRRAEFEIDLDTVTDEAGRSSDRKLNGGDPVGSGGTGGWRYRRLM